MAGVCTFRTLTLADALHVVARMRAEDRQCVAAVLGDVSDEVFAANRWQTNGPAWTLVGSDGLPHAIGGLTLLNDWTAVWWMVAIEGMPRESWRKLIRHARIVTANAANPQHPAYRHRIEAHVLASWKEAARFAEAMGMQHEGTRRAAGRGGEDIEQWAIVGPAKG